MLATVLRSLTRLTRTHHSFLSVALVNPGGVGDVNVNMNVDVDVNPAVLSRSTAAQLQTRGFLPLSGFHPQVCLFPTLLMKTLDHGVDAHLLVSTVRNAKLVEVVKDRTGHAMGKWCVWDR